MHDPKEYYDARILELTSTADSLRKRGDRIAWLRLLLALVVIASIYFGLVINSYFLWISLALIVGFMRLVQLHLQNKDEIEALTIMARLCSDELRMLAGDHAVFDPGPSAAYHGHVYANDLDIFGSTSLFKAINRSVTFGGRRMVIDALLEPLSDPIAIAKRRLAITDLAHRTEWRQRLYAVGVRSGETLEDISNLRLWLEQQYFFATRRHWILVTFLAGTLSIVGAAWMIFEGRFIPGIFFGVLVINTSVFQIIFKKVKQYFNAFGSRTALYRKLSEMFVLIGREKFESGLCTALQSQVVEASHAFLRLSRLHNLAEQRGNTLVAFVMNGLFMFDIWTIYRIEKWRLEYNQNVLPWISALNTIDMLSGCGNFMYNNPTFCNAETVVANPFIKAEDLGHPLISREVVVTNDYEVGTSSRSHIITGSNMAGKSTFIRAVGLNVVLALNGLPVCARSFSCSIMKIASCIRITDSLEDHASYFKAELDRLSMILSLLSSGDAYLVLLDEILRGTNSNDKHEGTLSFYRKLSSYNCIALLATHDLSVGKLEQEAPDRFANYCFESTVDHTELKFDYRLRRGVSSSTNATFLMRKLKLID